MSNEVKAKSITRITAKELSYCGLAIALATILGQIKLFEMPQGGTVTLLSMSCIVLVAYIFGPKVGIMVGVAHGLLQLLLNPYIVHPIQLILEYPLAFGTLGFAGFFHNSKDGLVKGYLVGATCRYICHVIAGVVFFASYAKDAGQAPLIYSMIYNASYMVPEMIATVIVFKMPPIVKMIQKIKSDALNNGNI